MTKVNMSLKEAELKKSRSDRIFLLVLALLFLVLLTIVTLNTYVFFNVQVKGPSMQPTLYTDDVVLVNRYGKIERGSIIIIAGEKDNGDWLIKRAIAVAGDTVRIEGGYVWLNGEMLNNEPYVMENGKTFLGNWKHWEEDRVIGEGEIFYLGDNRENSSDSRTLAFGTCEVSQVKGVVENRALPFKGVLRFFSRLFGR